MDQPTLSLKRTGGQVLIEALIAFLFVLSFLLFLQFFYFQAQKEIQKERISQKTVTVKRSLWFKPHRGDIK